MRKRLRIITISFIVSFIVMAVLSLISVEHFKKLTDYSNQADHSSVVISNLYALEGYVKDIDRGERGYMLTNDTAFIRRLNSSIDSIGHVVKKLRMLAGNNKEEGQDIIILNSALAIRITNLRQNLAYTDTARSNRLSPYFYDSYNSMVTCVKKIRAIRADEDRQLDKSTVNKKLYQRLTSDTIVFLFSLFYLITVTLFVIMISEFRKRFRSQDELRAKVIDLKRSHVELEQIAYAASHDLQEPLRKIQVFSNRFLFLKQDTLDTDTIITMERITAAANRMHELIGELVNLTILTKDEDNKKPVSLTNILLLSKEELADKIDRKKAVIDSDVLPTIHGYADQLNLLFKALLDNALKFTRPDIDPIINIHASVVYGKELEHTNSALSKKKFFCLVFNDNGIGFEDKFAEKMFRIFQRLHNQQSEFDGKGIGLAICQRIMANHEGYILAKGQVNNGATFSLYFPITE